MNKIWGYWTYWGSLINFKKKYEIAIDHKNTYVYCANHSSYMDIPTLFLAIPGYFTILGKSSLGQVPLFGYMFKRLYIIVNRKTSEGRYKAYTDALEAIDNKKSVVFFPEGTIPKPELNPKMGKFKDGPFKVAIEKQIPIIPITIPYNWIILPDAAKNTRVHRHKCELIFHKPIETTGMTMKDIESLKTSVYDIIDNKIKLLNK